jgi:integrase/recombinase XerD
MLRMGLRVCEISALRLEDIDWVRGEIMLQGKLRRQDRLPLPKDVGEALVAYLKRARPPSTSRQVFLRVHAPHGALHSSTVSAIVRRAGERTGIPFPLSGHRLRHTAATTMLRQGASLWEIAQVLRHSQTSTTAIYAKVDREHLRGLCRAWKGAKQ